jgi:hypothetical protein
MRSLATCFVLLIAIGAFSGCSASQPSGTGDAGGTDSTADGPWTPFEGTTIYPGEGISLDGNALRIGSSFAAVKAAIGTATKVLDLSPLGTRAHYSAKGIVLTLSHSADDPADDNVDDNVVQSIELSEGYEGRVEALGIGSTQAEVQAALGASVVDPFLGTWIYPKKGVVWQWHDSKAQRIIIFQPSF